MSRVNSRWQSLEELPDACRGRDVEGTDADTAYRRARERIDRVLARLSGPRPPEPTPPARIPEPRSNVTPEAYCAAVERAKAYIRTGDIYQIILSQRFGVPVPGLDPLALYRALRVVNPSPYMFLLEGADFTLVGAFARVALVRLTCCFGFTVAPRGAYALYITRATASAFEPT